MLATFFDLYAEVYGKINYKRVTVYSSWHILPKKCTQIAAIRMDHWWIQKHQKVGDYLLGSVGLHETHPFFVCLQKVNFWQKAKRLPLFIIADHYDYRDWHSVVNKYISNGTVQWTKPVLTVKYLPNNELSVHKCPIDTTLITGCHFTKHNPISSPSQSWLCRS